MRAGDFLLLLVAALVLAACGGSANETAEETAAQAATTAPSAPATTTTAAVPTTIATAAAPTTTTTEAVPTTTTTMVEAVEVSVMFSELSGNAQAFTAAICTVAADPDASIFETLGDFQQAVQQVVVGMTGVPELADSWLELANAGADTNEFLDAAVPICVAMGWSLDN